MVLFVIWKVTVTLGALVQIRTCLDDDGVLDVLRAADDEFVRRDSESHRNTRKGTEMKTVSILPETDCEYDVSVTSIKERKKEGITYSDFLVHARKTLLKFAKERKIRLKWCDPYGVTIKKMIKENKISEQDKELANYKVDFTSGRTFYGKATRCKKEEHRRGNEVFNICNKKAKPKQMRVPVGMIENKAKIEWEVHDALSVDNQSVSFKSKPPKKIFSDESGAPSTINDKKQTFNSRSIFNVTHVVTVEPKTKLKVFYTSKQENVEMPFTTNLFLKGHVVAAFDKTIPGEKSNITKFPITYFESAIYQRKGKLLVFNITGVFRGATAVTLETHYVEEKIDFDAKKCIYNL